jgi:hypothetical protein
MLMWQVYAINLYAEVGSLYTIGYRLTSRMSYTGEGDFEEDTLANRKRQLGLGQNT